ncbi:vacuolar protein sorting-associated protein 4-like [Anoplophora glabripennis]|uniref:vacuolar protein sorting-associated protein 4-like n=1 Tax=Anoplophora glabripennis TaxID=217634 RepID=UPI000874F548|nr:vacuolar protein sorting-associated protein 4-like [Anoplophora glabripennis]
MSQEFSQRPDSAVESYHLAIKNLELVESLFNSRHINITQIHQELQKCCEKLENIISEEDTSSPYSVDLLYLKQLILEQIKIMERKYIPQIISSTKVSSKMQHSREDRTQSIINSTIEIPAVNSLREIAGLWDVKKVLKSLVILPRNQPQLFINRRSCNSVLLFGPPGTGKTRLVHALASEANAVLHCISISAMLSPLVGQTEKNMQTVFEYIRKNEKFSILFIDEVDGFCRTRHDSEQDHTRRMKTELMCQMTKMEDVKNMFLICATNCPWDLDTAFLRRFHKRIYIPLPDMVERRELFQLFTKDTPLEEHSEYWDLLIQKTEGFSGSDLFNLVQSALNIPIIELEDTKIWKFVKDGFYEPVVTPGDFNSENLICGELDELPHRSVRARSPQILDLFNSLNSITASVSDVNLKRYEIFISK